MFPFDDVIMIIRVLGNESDTFLYMFASGYRPHRHSQSLKETESMARNVEPLFYVLDNSSKSMYYGKITS